MKLIKVSHIKEANKDSHYTREKLNEVCLGNGLKCYFSNIKKATKFLAETNRTLNIIAQELNRIYIELWSEQRKIFLTYHKLFVRSKVREYPVLIERSLDLMCTRSTWRNGNHFTFSYFSNIIEYMHDWIKEITTGLRRQNHNYNIDIFRSIDERINYIEKKLMMIGSEFTDAPPCPYDNSKKVPLIGVFDNVK